MNVLIYNSLLYITFPFVCISVYVCNLDVIQSNFTPKHKHIQSIEVE
jgi:hypothetical protein